MNLRLFFFLFIVFLHKNSLFSQEQKIKFTHSKTNEKEILKNELNPELLSKNITKTLDSISRQLKLKGYFYNTIDSIKKEKSNNLLVYMSFGSKIDSIIISVSNTDLQSLPKTNKLPIIKLDSFLQKANSILESKGKIFSKIRLTNIKLEDKIIHTSLTTEISKKRTIDKIIVRGYKDFPKSYLKHFLKIKPKQIFNKESLMRISNNLEAIPFAKKQKEPEILFSKDSTITYLYLSKVKQSNFDGLINFNSENANNLNINGNINLELNNLLDTGEYLHLNWNANGNDRQNLILKSHIPYIFNSPLSNISSFEIYRQDSTFLNSKFNTTFVYDINSQIKVGLQIENQNSNKILRNTNTLNNTSDFSSTLFGPSIFYQSLSKDFFFQPKIKIDLNTLIGNRKTPTSNDNQLKINLNTTFNFNINNRNNINLKNNTGILFSSNHLFNELYRIGGNNSIRGFDPQSIFSKKHNFFNIEYRYRTSRTSFLYSITDPGIIENINNKTILLFGYGLGYTFKRQNSIINIFLTNGLSSIKIKNTFNLSIVFKNFF